MCKSKKSRLIKEQEVSGLLSILGLKAPLSQVHLIGHIKWTMNVIWNEQNNKE